MLLQAGLMAILSSVIKAPASPRVPLEMCAYPSTTGLCLLCPPSSTQPHSHTLSYDGLNIRNRCYKISLSDLTKRHCCQPLGRPREEQ